MPLHLPEDFCYSCHNSGTCCRSFPKISVEEACEKNLLTLDPSSLEGLAVPVACMADGVAFEEDSASQRILCHRKSDGGCVFLRSDQLCSLHSSFGAQTKPKVCQEYPFFFRETPDGIYVGLSFVCPSVRGNVGQPLAEQRQELEKRCEGAFGRTPLDSPIMLNSRFRLAWEESQDLESALLELLDHEELPLSQRLISLNLLVNFADMYARGLYGDQPLVGEPRNIPGSQLGEFLQALRKTDYRELLRVASKRVTAPVLQRMFLGMITSFRSSVWKRRGRMAVLSRMMGQYARHASGLGGLCLEPFSARVSYKTLLSAPLPQEEQSSKLVLRYIKHCIFRKDLIWKTDLTRGVNLLIINCALLRWYAAACAAQRGVSLPEPEDYSEGIAQVERFYGCHSEFYQLFTQHPTLNDIIDAFMLRKNYPFVLLS